MKEHFATFLKGFAMGAANVVPGVSGGTIALITGIYERLIDALKAFDVEAIKLGAGFKIGALWKKIDGNFLTALMLGVGLSIVTLAMVLEYQLEHNPVIVLSVFLGLIAASIPSIGRSVKKWSPGVVFVFLVGVAIAVSMAFLTPASERTDMFYLGLCGVAAMCSMIIPGLSGSFVLLLMGNYRLVLSSVNALTSGDIGRALAVIIPVGIGAVLGLLVLSRLLSWLFKTHHDRAIGSITGFVVGSLVIIWPWKDEVTQTILKKGVPEEKVIGFENWGFPNFATGEAWLQLGAVAIGVILILAVEFFATRNQKS
jgi:putative membrane protein